MTASPDTHKSAHDSVPRCDSHIHVFSRERDYASAIYQPPRKDIDEFRRVAKVDGIRRAVLIQASIDGTDNDFLVATLRRTTDIALRGVVVIDEQTPGLKAMAEAGVRGIRVQDRTRLGQNDLTRLPELAARAAAMDWHVELNTEPARYETLETLLPRLPEGQALVLDHFGHITPGDEAELTGLYRLLDTGSMWIKLAPTRVSRQVGRYDDLAELVRQLADRYPDRCLWGSDWPHVMTKRPLPQSGDMLAFLQRTLTIGQYEACLSTNPATLYRF